MTTFDVLGGDELPPGFTYPHSFLRTTRLGLRDLEPWYLLEGDQLRRALEGLQQRYRSRRLVPFARRQDNDDIACWEVDHGEKVFVVHDFASPGWEQRAVFEDFWAWMRTALEDMIAFDP